MNNILNQNLRKLIESGIPISKAQFHAAVNNADKTPETHFSSESDVSSRRVEMLWTPYNTLVCFQKGKYFFVPMATTIYGNFINEAVASEEIQDKEAPRRGRPPLSKA